ncbi:MAG: hypothetical protein ABJF86_11710 [Tateyamaria sp.]|uniref:hypothetical protein n=1 Tax=Tateyamaria sp. TaxID=1929288 RepID=UPI003285F1DF
MLASIGKIMQSVTKHEKELKKGFTEVQKESNNDPKIKKMVQELQKMQAQQKKLLGELKKTAEKTK